MKSGTCLRPGMREGQLRPESDPIVLTDHSVRIGASFRPLSSSALRNVPLVVASFKATWPITVQAW